MAPPAPPFSDRPRLRLAFLGTPEFAVPTLEALSAAGHEIVCVYTQPPRPARRGQKPRPTAVQMAAEAESWPLRTPARLSGPAEQAAFGALALDCAVVVAYGLILPPTVLAAPRLGCVNVHASLLPRWRGAAPIQRAILAGDEVSGITIMQMDAGLDTGAILLQAQQALSAETNAGELHDRLAALGAELAVCALAGLAAGTLEAKPQPQAGVTYAAKIGRDDCRLDWRARADLLARQVRAFAPAPGAFALVPGPKGEERLKVLAAVAVDCRQPGPPGRVLEDPAGEGGLCVACADGCLRLLQVQRQGRAAMSGAELLRGFAIPPGLALPLPETSP